MKCPNCKKDVSPDSLFCEHCGQKLEKPKADKKDDEKFEDSNKIKKKIQEHLEFIGYEISVTDPVGRFLAKHQSKPTLLYTIGNGVSFASFYNIDPKKVEKNKVKALELLNQMNNTALLSSFSMPVANYNSLVCSAWYPGVYSKKAFAEFLDYFEGDIRRALALEGVMEIFS